MEKRYINIKFIFMQTNNNNNKNNENNNDYHNNNNENNNNNNILSYTQRLPIYIYWMNIN